MMKLFCPEITICKAEDAGFENTILRHGKTTSKSQELPPLTIFYLSQRHENQNFMPGISLISCHLLLDLLALHLYISLSIQKNHR